MRQVTKFLIHEQERQTGRLPRGARALSFERQGEGLYLRVIASAEAEQEPAVLWLYEDGPVPERTMEHLGTAVEPDGWRAWHLFRETTGEFTRGRAG